MTLKTNKLRDAISFALVGTSAFAATGVAFAEDKKDSDQLDTVVVTGSRIPRAAEVEGTSPVLSIDRAAIEATGLTSVGDVLFNITASDGGALRNVTTSTNGSDGTQNVSLRGLGATRTLVLVNGRRWVTAGITGSALVDLNTIPISVVERIEVLKDGASAIYGSDAIAGVINVITKKNFDGAAMNAYIGSYTKGDGSAQAYDFTVGANNDRWNAVLSLSYSQNDPVYQGDRELSSVPVSGGGNIASGGFFGSGNTLRGNFTRCSGPTSATASGFRTCSTISNGPGTGVGTGLSGNSVTLIEGRTGRSASDYRTFINYSLTGFYSNVGDSDRYNFSPVNYLLQPIERFNVYGQASLRLTDNVNANAMATYVSRSSNQQLAEVPLSMDIRGTQGPQWAFAPTAGNVFNPFGTDLRAVGFRAAAVGPRKNYYNNDNTAVTLWLDGQFDLGGRDMYWDAGYSYLDARFNLRGQNYINLFNLQRAVGNSGRNAISGALECYDSAGAVIRGCVPYNLFGGPDLGLAAGTISRAEYDAMNDYIRYTLNESQQLTTKDYFANLSGSIVDLPAGPLGFAVGLETRKTSFVDSPDSLVAGGGSSNNFRLPTSGEQKSDEIYAELNVPVLADLPGAKLLELNFAARKSSYDTNGVFNGEAISPDLGGDTSKKVGIKWQIFDDLMLRGTYSESFRAPDVLDLYAGGQEGFPTAADPCNTTNFNNATTDQARCLAAGVQPGGVAQPNTQIRSLNGGNPDLQPEFGKTYSAGFVYSPSWVQGLNITLDWYRIKLTDALAVRGAQSILNSCYRLPTAVGGEPDAALRNQYCSFVDRTTTGDLAVVNTSSFNLTKGEVRGWDMQVAYALPENSWGKFSWQWDNTYQTQNNLFGKVGWYNGAPTWRLRSNLTTSWQKGDWDATWAMRYYSALKDDCSDYSNFFEYGITPTEICPSDGINVMGSRLYHDVQVGFKTPWNGKVAVGARNIFGRDPPVTHNSFAGNFDGSYDLPGGGYWYLQYNQKF